MTAFHCWKEVTWPGWCQWIQGCIMLPLEWKLIIVHIKIYHNLEKVIMKWENGFDQVLRNNILTFASRSDGMACYKPVLLMRITRTAELKKKSFKRYQSVSQATGPWQSKILERRDAHWLGSAFYALLSARGHLLTLKRHTVRG